MEIFTIPVKTIEVRITGIKVEAEDLSDARKRVGKLLEEHNEICDYGDITEYKNLIVCDSDYKSARDYLMKHPLTDEKGHVVLKRFGRDALIFRPETECEPFVLASGYDEETGEWASGTYRDDPVDLLLEADAEYIADGCTLFTREDIRNRIGVLNDAGGFNGALLKSDEQTVNKVACRINAQHFHERCEEVMQEYIDDVCCTVADEHANEQKLKRAVEAVNALYDLIGDEESSDEVKDIAGECYALAIEAFSKQLGQDTGFFEDTCTITRERGWDND